jgi:hypothetical protein
VLQITVYITSGLSRSGGLRLHGFPQVRDGALSRLFAFFIPNKGQPEWTSDSSLSPPRRELHAPTRWPVKPRYLDACRAGVCCPTSSTAYVRSYFNESPRRWPRILEILKGANNFLALVVARIDCVSHRRPQRPPHSTIAPWPGETAWAWVD